MTSPLRLGPGAEKGSPEVAQAPGSGPEGRLGENWKPPNTCPGSWEGSRWGHMVISDICCLWKNFSPAAPAP